MRFAYARIMQETNALSPVATSLADFEGSHYLAGDDLATAVGPGGHEVAGFFKKFLLFFLPYNRKTIFVRTRGVTDFDAAYRLTFDGPMHPRDPVDDWRPRDRARRG